MSDIREASLSNPDPRNAIFTVEIFHLVAGKTDELIKLETDDRQFAEYTAALAIHKNSWRLVSKNF